MLTGISWNNITINSTVIAETMGQNTHEMLTAIS
jgi:phage regulator Rha-like protein